MKKMILTSVLLLLVTVAYAQSSLPMGRTQFNAGFGLSDGGLPVYVGFDHAVSRDVTLGAEVSYRDYTDNWDNEDYDHNVWGISGNVNYHFNTVLEIPRNWDFYAGLNVGFYDWNSPRGYHGDHTSGLGLGAQVGGRYFFTNKVGLNFELGGGNEFSGGKIGLTIKL
jgi:outer membrane immunogenic protein